MLLTNNKNIATIVAVEIATVSETVRKENPMKLIYTLVNKNGEELHPEPEEVGSKEEAAAVLKRILEEAKKNGDTIKSATTVG